MLEDMRCEDWRNGREDIRDAYQPRATGMRRSTTAATTVAIVRAAWAGMTSVDGLKPAISSTGKTGHC